MKKEADNCTFRVFKPSGKPYIQGQNCDQYHGKLRLVLVLFYHMN